MLQIKHHPIYWCIVLSKGGDLACRYVICLMVKNKVTSAAAENMGLLATSNSTLHWMPHFLKSFTYFLHSTWWHAEDPDEKQAKRQKLGNTCYITSHILSTLALGVLTLCLVFDNSLSLLQYNYVDLKIFFFPCPPTEISQLPQMAITHSLLQVKKPTLCKHGKSVLWRLGQGTTQIYSNIFYKSINARAFLYCHTYPAET